MSIGTRTLLAQLEEEAGPGSLWLTASDAGGGAALCLVQADIPPVPIQWSGGTNRRCNYDPRLLKIENNLGIVKAGQAIRQLTPRGFSYLTSHRSSTTDTRPA